jgi:hypothetical protein
MAKAQGLLPPSIVAILPRFWKILREPMFRIADSHSNS